MIPSDKKNNFVKNETESMNAEDHDWHWEESRWTGCQAYNREVNFDFYLEWTNLISGNE